MTLPTGPEGKHTWEYCWICHSEMVRCGYCGNNCCNGGSRDGCPDRCASAYAMQDAGRAASPPSETPELTELRSLFAQQEARIRELEAQLERLKEDSLTQFEAEVMIAWAIRSSIDTDSAEVSEARRSAISKLRRLSNPDTPK